MEIATILVLAVAGGALIGWFFGRRSVGDEERRRWGEKLRKEIEDAGGVDAWKLAKAPDQAPVPNVPAELARAAAAGSDDHPLAGSLLTAGGVWTVIVLTDDDDDRGRRFALNLVPPNRRPADAIPFIVRVPRTVITQERPQTWAADLREQLAGWINTNAIERGEMIWWPNDRS